MNEIFALVAVIATCSGAVFSTLKGYWASPDGYKAGKLISSLIISIMTSLMLVNFNIINDTVEGIGFVGMVATFLVIGFSADQGLSSLDK